MYRFQIILYDFVKKGKNYTRGSIISHFSSLPQWISMNKISLSFPNIFWCKSGYPFQRIILYENEIVYFKNIFVHNIVVIMFNLKKIPFELFFGNSVLQFMHGFVYLYNRFSVEYPKEFFSFIVSVNSLKIFYV